MSTNHNPDNQEHVSRREAMRRGALGAAGMIAAGGLSSRVFAAEAEKTPEQIAAEQKAARDAAAKAKAKNKGKIKSVIQIFLWGGMSHNDTWDPKPGTGYDYMGEFDKVHPHQRGGNPAQRTVPQLAKQADKYSLIRSMTHGINGHETAAYLMQTGHKPGGRLAYPSVGAIFTFFKKDAVQRAASALRRDAHGQPGGFPRRASWAPRTNLSPRAAIRTRTASRCRGSSTGESPTTGKRPAVNWSTR